LFAVCLFLFVFVFVFFRGGGVNPSPTPFGDLSHFTLFLNPLEGTFVGTIEYSFITPSTQPIKRQDTDTFGGQ